MWGKMERYILFNWADFVDEAIKRRKSRRITQEKMAVLAGVSKSTLNSFEQGKTTITLENALKTLWTLGLD